MAWSFNVLPRCWFRDEVVRINFEDQTSPIVSKGVHDWRASRCLPKL
jgi:hypothetical protein